MKFASSQRRRATGTHWQTVQRKCRFLISLDQLVYTQAIEVAMYGVSLGTHENAINIPIHMHMCNSKTKEHTLIDSRATENFLDYRMAKWLNLGTKSLDTPQPIINANGSPNGKGALTWCTELMVAQNGKEALQQFFIAYLGLDRMILGFPWLQEWNPDIDWKKKTVKGGPISTQML